MNSNSFNYDAVDFSIGGYNMSTIERIYNALSAMGYKSRIEFIDDNNNHEVRIYTDKEMKEEEKKEIKNLIEVRYFILYDDFCKFYVGI